ncbi:SMI1/KNR4 family protein [Chitinophaga polysaccharea]|uniref:SMI1/KNR4 family protein n=1 Tax=Chitinophaga polysaccharea TaxID=1293035 RepID=UPI001156D7B6|nr:SMI1/KNR4 family protein [Chitinophaga polysaccharea]
MENSIIEICRQWKHEKIRLNPGASPDLISAVEASIGFGFPAGFRKLYMEINGFADCDWRENMFSIWPLERILEEYISSDDSSFIGFSDFLIHSHTIGFVKSQPGVFKKYGGGEYFFIAVSFLDAVKLINANSDLIY